MIDASGGLPSNAMDSVESRWNGCSPSRSTAWMHGERPPIKLFMDRYPAIADHPKALVELVNQEIVLRQIRGETPRPEDYLIDFPDLAEPLSRLFEVHGALSSPAEPHVSPDLASREMSTQRRARSEIAVGCRGYQDTRSRGPRDGAVWGWCISRGTVPSTGTSRSKCFRRDGRAIPSTGHRFEREAAAVAKCQHPNLVQIHEIGEYDGQSYLALEYVEGDTLANSLAGVPQPPRAAAALVETLARAIDHAHSRGVVHRDLKPANVLLTADGQPKITDFGLAKIDESTTQTEVGAIMGTLAYMAPEQAHRRDREGRASRRHPRFGRDLVRSHDRPAAISGRISRAGLSSARPLRGRSSVAHVTRAFRATWKPSV